MNRFYIKPCFGHFNVIDSKTEKMIVGYSKKIDAEQTSQGLNSLKDSEIEQTIKELKTTEGYGKFLKL